MTTSHDERLKRAMSAIRVRFARDGEGMAIAQMVHCSHDAVPNVSWDRIYPSWIVAEHDGEVIGCIQVCHSVPIGRLEFLSFAPGLAYRTRALAVKAMLELGCLSLKKSGAVGALGLTPFSDRSFRDFLKANGCKVVSSGNVMGMGFQ